VVDTLYFGGAYPDGVVTSAQWQQFVTVWLRRGFLRG
jgi:hypothetical protein